MTTCSSMEHFPREKLLYGKNDLINEHCDGITGCLYYLDVGHQA